MADLVTVGVHHAQHADPDDPDELVGVVGVGMLRVVNTYRDKVGHPTPVS